ncbi:MAG: sigma-70 family RNA polymerase sigma factor, partial [Acidobacteriaceae bacterium]|nr:sigma-70 family RNA polymerase sigma factor [Acidobacteriaceae bacterium]
MTETPELSREEPTSAWADMPEHELVRMAKSGNSAAFEELISRTGDTCHRVAGCILRTREDVRDEVQNAFWIAYSRMALFTCQSKFSTWLVRIVINCCYMRLRVTQRTPVLTNCVMTEGGEWHSCEAVTRQTPEIDLGRREVRQHLRRELRGIPPLLRVPIQMHYLNELTVKEVASELGLTVAAAKSRLHRGHLYLRDRMLKHVARRGPASL